MPAYVVVVLAVLGCRGLEVGCPRPFIPAFRVTITDAVTGAPAWYRSTLIVANATTYDSTALPWMGTWPDSAAPLTLSSWTHTRGIYDVRVRKEGYQLWERSAIGVAGDVCNITSVPLDVPLQPES